jgi:predicted permease
MAKIGEWLRRLNFLLRRGAMEDELRREMESHRAMLDDRRTFGNTLRLRDESRDAWGWRWFDDFVQDSRFALRTLGHSPGFALTAVVTLALGIGVNIGMFSFVNGLLLRPLYANADEVVELDIDPTTPNAESRDFSYPNYRDIQEGTTDIFASLAAHSINFVGLDAGNGARSALAAAVTANYFQLLSAPPALGRPFTAEEERPGAGIRVVVISYQLWEQLGAGADTLGRLVRINGEQFTVVGVARDGFLGTGIPGPEVWLPLGVYGIFSRDEGARTFGSRESHALNVIGRLRGGISKDRAEAAVATVGRRLEQAFPAVNAGYAIDLSDSAGPRLFFMPGMGQGPLTGIALLLMLMPLTVLLVACLNLADLLLARGHVRRQELAIRSSLGGGRSRLVRQLLTEGFLLALVGGAIGLWVSTWATKTLMASFRPLLPAAVSLPDVSVDWRVLLGTTAFGLAATLIFGAWPALALTGRAAAVDLKRQTGNEGRRPGGVRIGNALVIGQIALSLLLLASGGLFTMSVIRMTAADPGFRLDGGVIVQVDPGLAGYDEARGRQAHLALLDRLRTVPGVEAITIASRFALNGFGDERVVAPAGVPFEERRRQGVNATFTVIGRDYVRVLGLPMLGGRDFTDAEMLPGSPEHIAIIDDALAERLWPGEDALGRLIQLFDDEESDPAPTVRVVGIIPALSTALGNPPSPHVYVPLGQHYESAMAVQMRVGEGDRAMVANIARVIRELDERLPIVSVATWRDHIDAGMEALTVRASAGVFSAFGAIALLLAVIGVYGVKSYVVSRRTREFGIRIAIGAHPRALLWQVLREGGRTTVIGIGLGLLLALGAGQFLQGILYGLRTFEPMVLVTAPLILLAASLLASFLPARRAASVNPTIALRAE